MAKIVAGCAWLAFATCSHAQYVEAITKFEPRVVAWYYGKYPHYPPEDIDFSRPGGVSHLVIGGLTLQPNGTVEPCSWTQGSVLQKAYQLAKKSNAKVQLTFPTDNIDNLTAVDNATHPNPVRKNFMASIKQALDACGADGFEVDWEGPPTQEKSDHFLQWLIEVRHLLGSNKYAVSFDTEPPQWVPGDYRKPTPNIFFDKDNFGNEAAGTGGNLDKNAAEIFINFMTYFQTGVDSIDYYVTSVNSAVSFGYPKSTMVIAIPYYEQTRGQNEWSLICGDCPNLAYADNFCNSAKKNATDGANIVGKKANYEIGKLIASAGLSVFPWVFDYDVSPNDNKTCGNNNLFKYLKKGLLEGGGHHADNIIFT